MQHIVITNTASITTLTACERSALWASFFTAMDRGDVGSHPHYAELAPLYEAGEYEVDAEAVADYADNIIEASFDLSDIDLTAYGEPAY